jgi:hypothetical protein
MGEAKRRKLIDPNYGKAKSHLEFNGFYEIKELPDLSDAIKNHPSAQKIKWFCFIPFCNIQTPDVIGFVLYTKDLKQSCLISINDGSWLSLFGFDEQSIINQALHYRRGLLTDSLRAKFNMPRDSVICYV